jgi:hypothetical protein
MRIKRVRILHLNNLMNGFLFNKTVAIWFILGDFDSKMYKFFSVFLGIFDQGAIKRCLRSFDRFSGSIRTAQMANKI